MVIRSGLHPKSKLSLVLPPFPSQSFTIRTRLLKSALPRFTLLHVPLK